MTLVNSVLYGLYKLFKTDINLITFTRDVNVDSGKISDNKTPYSIKAIKLPANMFVEIFGQGADVIKYDTVIILDTKIYSINVDNFENAYIVCDSIKYTISDVQKYPGAYVFKCIACPGEVPNNVVNISIESRIEMDQTVL